MFKKIRDFIYDINDIFVAIIILAVAAGIIYWRSTSIMAYPAYLAEKNNSNTISDIDFSDIDLEPTPVDPGYNYDPENQGSLVDPDNPDSPSIDTSDVPVPGNDNTTNNSNNENSSENDNTSNNAENTNTSENDNTSNNAENDDTIEFEVPSATSWFAIADRLAEAGLMDNTDSAKIDFVYTAAAMNLDTKLYPGTYTLKKGMSYEEIIRILCRAD